MAVSAKIAENLVRFELHLSMYKGLYCTPAAEVIKGVAVKMCVWDDSKLCKEIAPDVVQSDLAELEGLHKQATRKYVVDILSLEIRKLETMLIKLQEEKVHEMAASSHSTQVETSASKRYQVNLKGYGWDQSDKFVKVFVTLKNVHVIPSNNIHCDITENSMELRVEDLDNKDYAFAINKLLKPINPKASYWKQKVDMVIIFLAKETANVNWSHITEIEKRFEENKSNKFKDENMDSKDPQDSLMKLMRNMYESGDDDMKRMITKAWVEGQEKQTTKSMDL